MQIGRRNTIIAFVLLGAFSVGLAIALNITWAFHWRSVAAVVLGIILFGFIIVAVSLNTIFLVREIRRSEQHDSFINAVTHELKTPIASVRLYLETLQSRPVAEQQRQEFYRVMLEDTDRLLGTVEQVLHAGRVVQSRRLRQRRVDVQAVLAECVELARKRHHLFDGQMRMENLAASEDSRVLGDWDELRIAISNVLDNAVKYSIREIDIRAELLTLGPDVLVRVSDRGVGIPPSELKRIFRRFYRVPLRTAMNIKGTGLGLFLVKSIARRHGGDASAESAGLGKGTTVIIRLPRIVA
ncbi:MAG: HAMP domain-containing sensor histidine kinase [Candidatus Korobacteraceae bacterium]|jgi:signal transduction histidine kinase